MFKKIFIESGVEKYESTQKILKQFPLAQKIKIENHEDIFGKVKKPYLLKRNQLNLFLASKKGSLVKETPSAYGFTSQFHYYFIHSYNCIYECNYCYLQGYFHSPDIVLFLNHDEIFQEVIRLARVHKLNGEVPWFHSGEYSDSLALSHLTGETSHIYQTFRQIPEARLELRTKSVNIKEILKQDPLSNVYITFSLAPHVRIVENEHKTPSLALRLAAMQKLWQQGHKVGVHLDPMIWSEDMFGLYENFFLDLNAHVPMDQIEYFSLGVVRFTKDVFAQVQKNYPESIFLSQKMKTSFDHKVRYIRPLRKYILKTIKSKILSYSVDPSKVYFCMEDF